MASFASIDDGLHRWASDHKINVSTEYKDFEVRTFFLAARSGTVQVWIEPQDDGRFEVVGCNNRPGAAKRLDRVPVAGTDIGAALDGLIALITRWKQW
jgi:hypothetical protein